LVYQCQKCGKPIVRTYWSKVFSKADVGGTAFALAVRKIAVVLKPFLADKRTTLLNSLGAREAKDIKIANMGLTY
jgi:hypothetical protein